MRFVLENVWSIFNLYVNENSISKTQPDGHKRNGLERSKIKTPFLDCNSSCSNENK